MTNEFRVDVNTVELNVSVIQEDPIEVISNVVTSPVINVEITGAGPKGDKGEPFKYEDFTPEQLASLSGDIHYTHDQILSSKVWHINHNLGKYPSVSVVDSGGSLVEGEVSHISNNQLTVEFSAMFSGKVYLN